MMVGKIGRLIVALNAFSVFHTTQVLAAPWKQLFPSTTNEPLSRDFHASARCSEAGITVVFGGRGDEYDLMNDVWIYEEGENQNNVEWLELLPSGSGDEQPSPRRGATLVVTNEYYEEGAAWCQLVVFGGESYNIEGQRDSWVLDISKTREQNGSSVSGRWSPVTITSEMFPSERSDHLAVFREGLMYIYGGIASMSAYYSKLYGDVWSFKLTHSTSSEEGDVTYSGVWELLSQPSDVEGDYTHSETPPPRSAAAGGLYRGATKDEDRLVVHGGRSYATETNDWDVLSDFWVFNFEKNTWEAKLHQSYERDESISRIFHSGVVVGDYFVTFGGYSRYTSRTGHPEGFVYNDVLMTKVAVTEGESIHCPLAEVAVSSASTEAEPLEEGGSKDFSTHPVWCRIMIQPSQANPHVRWAHTAVLSNGQMQVFGGQYQESSSELWALDIGAAMEQAVVAVDEMPSTLHLLENIDEILIGMIALLLVCLAALLILVKRQRDRRQQMVSHRKKRGTKPEVIQQLPVVRYQGSGTSKEAQDQSSTTQQAESEFSLTNGNEKQEEVCPICLVEFEDNEQVRQLPCRHIFHLECIGTWLVRESFCPMCKQSVEMESTTSWSGVNTVNCDHGSTPSAPVLPDLSPVNLTTVDNETLPVAIAIQEVDFEFEHPQSLAGIRRVRSHADASSQRRRSRRNSRRSSRRTSMGTNASTSGHSVSSTTSATTRTSARHGDRSRVRSQRLVLTMSPTKAGQSRISSCGSPRSQPTRMSSSPRSVSTRVSSSPGSVRSSSTTPPWDGYTSVECIV